MLPVVANLPLFMLASLGLLLAPGPAVLYIVARSLDQGRTAGMVSVLSIEVGNFFYALLAAIGISALVFSSPVLFSIVKILGAAYLIYLGVRKFLAPGDLQLVAQLEPQSYRQIFSQGVTVAVLNPKTALFFVAFLPQFAIPSNGNIPVQMFFLGCVFVLMACVTDSMYALLASLARNWLRSSPVFLKAQKYITGSIFIGLGLLAVLELRG